METPQLSEKQLEILQNSVYAFRERNVDTLTWVVADVDRDKGMYESRKAGQDSVEGLVSMGLLDDITETSREYTQALTAQSEGRLWKVFRLSELGHKMFAQPASTVIN